MLRKNLSCLLSDNEFQKPTRTPRLVGVACQERFWRSFVVLAVFAILTCRTATPVFAQTEAAATAPSVESESRRVNYAAAPKIAGGHFFKGTVVDEEERVSSDTSAEPPTMPFPPMIDLTVAAGALSTFTLSGVVLSDNPYGLTVTFGGVADGFTTTTQPDGSYFFSFIWGGEPGLVTAETVDQAGLNSNIAEDYISPIF